MVIYAITTTMFNKDTFCSSPWLHVRVNYAGKFVPCRWYDRISTPILATDQNINNIGLLEFFNSQQMRDVRTNFLENVPNSGCSACLYQDKFGKLSGRKKQLYRSGLDVDFDPPSSKHWPLFVHSMKHNGEMLGGPIDLQLDLGDTCNSACIMCYPGASSKLNADYSKLSQISKLFKFTPRIQSWSSDPLIVKNLVTDIVKIPNIEYIHFLGGETLYLDSFYQICDALIEADVAKNIIIGTTTNGTVWSTKLAEMLPKFKAVHLGISIETITPLNDYIRYPSTVADIKANIHSFIELANANPSLLLSLRITPSVLSVLHLGTMFQYMIDNKIVAESCDILTSPSCLRMELLPRELIDLSISRLMDVVIKNNIVRAPTLTNSRDRSSIDIVISNRIYEYIDFLSNMTIPDDLEKQRYDLVEFISSFEALRGNRILEVAPEFADFLRQYGYKY